MGDHFLFLDGTSPARPEDGDFDDDHIHDFKVPPYSMDGIEWVEVNLPPYSEIDHLAC